MVRKILTMITFATFLTTFTLLVGLSHSAKLIVGNAWDGSNTMTYEELTKSSKNDNIVMMGRKDVKSELLAVSMGTWDSEKGFQASHSFTILPKAYSKCDHLSGGFLTDSLYSSDTYLVWTCEPTVNSKTRHYFFVRIGPEGTIKNEAVFLPKADVSGLQLYVIYTNSNIVATVNNGSEQVILGLDYELKLAFEIRYPESLTIAALGRIENSSSFVVGTTPATLEPNLFTLTIFDSKGAQKVQQTYSTGKRTPGINGIAASSSGIFSVIGFENSILATLVTLEDLTVIKSLEMDVNANDEYFPRADGNVFAVVSPNGYSFAAWIFDSTLKQTNAFELDKIQDEFQAFGGVEIVSETWLVLNTAITNTDHTKLLGSAIWGYDITVPNKNLETPPTMSEGIELEVQDRKIDWTTTFVLSEGEFGTPTDTFMETLHTDFKKIPLTGNDAGYRLSFATPAFLMLLIFYVL